MGKNKSVTIASLDSEVRVYTPACSICVLAGVPQGASCGHGRYRGVDILDHPEWKELVAEFYGEVRLGGAHSPYPGRPSFSCGAMEATLRPDAKEMPKYTSMFVDMLQVRVSWGRPEVLLFAYWSARESRMCVTMRGIEHLDDANTYDFEQARRSYALLKALTTRGRKPNDKEQFRIRLEVAVEKLHREDLPITQEWAADKMGISVSHFKTQLRVHELNDYFGELTNQAKVLKDNVDKAL